MSLHDHRFPPRDERAGPPHQQPAPPPVTVSAASERLWWAIAAFFGLVAGYMALAMLVAQS